MDLDVGVTLKTNKREESNRPLVLGFTVRKAGKPTQAPPVCCTWIGVIACGERLSREGSYQLRENGWVLEPRLEVAGTGLDNGARREAVARELRERDLGEIVEGGIAMLTGRSM
jgi:hypothetical protein